MKRIVLFALICTIAALCAVGCTHYNQQLENETTTESETVVDTEATTEEVLETVETDAVTEDVTSVEDTTSVDTEVVETEVVTDENVTE